MKNQVYKRTITKLIDSLGADDPGVCKVKSKRPKTKIYGFIEFVKNFVTLIRQVQYQ